MQKARYEVDPYNRLVRTGLRKFRQVIDGRFRIDGDNELSYHVKAPLSAAEDVPHQVRFKGSWSLDGDHRLRFTLDKSARQTFGDELTLEGDIIDVRDNALLFAVSTASKDGSRSTYVMAVGGRWKADERNRLSFHVKREGGRVDILTFTGTWEVGKDHRIIYRYERARLMRKKRRSHTLVFSGHWDIRDSLRISYVLSGDTDSAFDFTAEASLFRKDYIQYEIGVRVADRKAPAPRTVRLYGTWRLKKETGLLFEVEYEKGEISAIVFGADIALTSNGGVSFRLRNAANKRDLGITLELSRKILRGDGEAFMRTLASRRETAVYAGAAWRW